MRVVLVIGTRPELIKLAPVARAFAERGVQAHLLLTGQHPSLDLRAAGLAGFPNSRLQLDLTGLEPLDAAEAIARGCEAALRPQSPDWVLVQGDTTSALGGALGAARSGFKLAHVEAGLRTGDPGQPWPEEPFRIQIDRISDLLFAPTPLARDNLLSEGARGALFVTGNTGIDAFRELRENTAIDPSSSEEPPLVLLTVHRRENLEAMPAIAEGLRRAARACAFRPVLITHPNPGTAERARRAFAPVSNLELLPPRSPEEMLQLLNRARVVASDSGGISEEAPTLGVPLLILRDKTERPEAVTAGNAMLVGCCPDRIASGLTAILTDKDVHAAMAVPRDLFGDGHAAGRIADALLAYSARRDQTHRPSRHDRRVRRQAPALTA